MKSIKIFFAVIALAFASNSFAQERFKPLSTWPYIYEDFQPGKIRLMKGSLINYDQLNINVTTNKIHYIKNNTIMVVDMSSFIAASIGDDVYVNYAGRIYQVVRETENGDVLLDFEFDADEMAKTSIGYGKSSVASTMNVSTSALEGSSAGDAGSLVNKSISTLAKDKMSGDRLPVKEKLYIRVDGRMIRALKGEVLSADGLDKNKMKDYFKANKVDFKSLDDLAKLIEYIHSL